MPEGVPGQHLPSNRLRAIILGRREDNVSYSDLVAHYSSLWPLLERPENQRYSSQALLGLEFLKTGRLKEASAIVNDVEFQISTPKALSYVMRGVGQFIRVTILVALAGVYALWLASLGPQGFGNHFAALDPKTYSVLIAALCGMLGSVVSILLRIAEFESTRGRSKTFLELTGATLPLVGGAFGAVIAALLAANVVNISFGNVPGGNVWLYVVVGFLSGFSERFSRSFLNMAEGRLTAATERSIDPTPTGGAQTGQVVANARLDVTGKSRRPRQS